MEAAEIVPGLGTRILASDREVTRLGESVFRTGAVSDDAMKLFKNFTGGDPDVTPLLKRRGLTKTAPAEAPAPTVPPK